MLEEMSSNFQHESQGVNEMLEESKSKMAAQLDDASKELHRQSTTMIDLENKLIDFDKIMAEEKLNAEIDAG